MLILAMIFLLTGILLVLRSGELSGRVISPDVFLREHNFFSVLRHIFKEDIFSGKQFDRRILSFGLAGLVMIIVSAATLCYALFVFVFTYSR